MKTHIYSWSGDIHPECPEPDAKKMESTECKPVQALTAEDIRLIVRDELSRALNVNKNNETAVALQKEVIVRRGQLLADIFNCDYGEDLPKEIKRRIEEEMLGGHRARL